MQEQEQGQWEYICAFCKRAQSLRETRQRVLRLGTEPICTTCCDKALRAITADIIRERGASSISEESLFDIDEQSRPLSDG